MVAKDLFSQMVTRVHFKTAEDIKRPDPAPLAEAKNDSTAKKSVRIEKAENYFYYFVMIVCLLGAVWLFLIFTKQIN